MDKNYPTTIPHTSVAKILHDNDRNASTFEIPSALVRSYGDVLPSEATFRIDDSGKSWRIKIEKFRDLYFFTDGWKQFAHDVDIKTRDYLLFNSPGLMSPSYRVENNSHKDFFNSGDQTGNAEDEDRFAHQENGPIDSSWSFMVELKSYNLNQLLTGVCHLQTSNGLVVHRPFQSLLTLTFSSMSQTIPRKHVNVSRVRAADILILQDVEGRKWPVRVTSRSSGRLSITAGWYEFLIANRVVVGSTMSFKFISCSNNMVEARVVKEGTNRKALFSLVKRIGGKFVVCEPHGASGRSEGSDSSHKANEHVDGAESYCKASDHDDVPESFHKAREQAADHINIADEESGFGSGWSFFNDLKKRNTAERPETSNNTSESAEGSNGSSHKTSKYAKGLEEFHRSSAWENENQCPAEENGFGVGRRWTFSKELKKHNASKLDVPRDFCKLIGKATGGEIKLEDRKGRKWPVHIEHRKCGVYTMTTGWIDFLVGNKVCIGSTVSFELIPNSDVNVIEARVVDTGNAHNVLFVKRGEGPCVKYF